MDSSRFREITIMPKQLNQMPSKRYYQTEIIEHLASQYVLGTLTINVQRRVANLLRENTPLEQRINYWQERLVSLDHTTEELPPSELSWQKIAEHLAQNKITNTAPQQSSNEIKKHNQRSIYTIINTWLTVPFNRYASGLSFATCALIALLVFNPDVTTNDPLSYVAVLTEQNGQAHMVASTYGNSQKLVVNIINSPEINDNQALELWVVSKTDEQARSLGIIPIGKTLIEQQLTTPQWRLIKDSQALIVTIEDLGGSPIGEPSELVVSRGLCIRLQEWQKDA